MNHGIVKDMYLIDNSNAIPITFYSSKIEEPNYQKENSCEGKTYDHLEEKSFAI
jgi:hypothetical protein